MIEKEMLETVLLAHWGNFLDTTRLFSLTSLWATKHLNKEVQVDNITLSRFEPIECGFLLWIDSKVGDLLITSEAHLSNTGEITHLKTVS